MEVKRIKLKKDDLINKTIEFRKSVYIKLPDAFIAATAMNNNLELLSSDKKDFYKIFSYIN